MIPKVQYSLARWSYALWQYQLAILVCRLYRRLQSMNELSLRMTSSGINVRSYDSVKSSRHWLSERPNAGKYQYTSNSFKHVFTR